MKIYLYKQQRNKYHSLVSLLLSTLLILLGLFSYKIASAAESVSVAVVNITFLMKNSPQSKAANTQLKEKFLPQEEKLSSQLTMINKLESELQKLASSDRDLRSIKERELRSSKRARERALQDFREELRFSRDSALDIVQKEVFSAIDEVRELQQIDIILQTFLSADKRVDITNQVLEHLKKKMDKEPKEKTPQQ